MLYYVTCYVYVMLYNMLCLLCFITCDLSRDNVPNASHSNAERNGKRTGDERLGKPFETGTVNG